MKKILFLFLLFSVSLFATKNVKIQSVEQKYSQAIGLYKSKNYQQSYEILSKLYLTKLSDAKFNFYLGRSAYETGHYEIALAAFERVEMLNPQNLRNKLEMGRTYYMLEMYEEAQNSFNSVLINPNLPQNVRTNIEVFLAKISKAQQKSFTYATLTLDFLYDSNINYASISDSYDIGDITLPTTKEKHDYAYQTYAEIVNIYDIGEKNGFAIKNALSVFIKDYSKENDYDLKYISYVPGLVYKTNGSTLEMSFGVDLLTLANDDYLKSYFLTPKFEYSHTNSLKSISYFKYQKKKFQQVSNYDLDANHYELSYALLKILNSHSYIQASLSGIMERKTQGQRVDVDYDEYKLALVYGNQFTPIYGVDLYAEFKNRHYLDKSDLFNKNRDDDSMTLGTTINARILPTLTLNLKGSYSKLNSNIPLYTYKKYVLSAGIIKKF